MIYLTLLRRSAEALKSPGMAVYSTTDRIDLAELSKFINKRKVNDLRKHKMVTIEHALINGGSLRTVNSKLNIGKNEIYCLRAKDGNVTTNIYRIVEVAEESYAYLCSSRNISDGNYEERKTDESDIRPLTTDDLKKALTAIQTGKTAGEA